MKKPIKKFLTIGENNYGILKTTDLTFLVIESFKVIKGRLFKREMPFSLDMLPLNSVTLSLLLALNETEVIDELLPEGVEKEDEAFEGHTLYSDIDFHAYQKSLSDLTGASSRMSFPKTYHSSTVRGLIKEGNKLFAVEQLSPRTQYVWLADYNKLGTLRITRVFTQDILGETSRVTAVKDMTTFLITKEIADKTFLAYMEGK